jgi:NAD-dependent SIR2 family protein deacetylase
MFQYVNFIYIIGIRNTSISSDIKNHMEDILNKTSKNLKKDKVFNALKLLETYLPDVISSVHEKLKTPNMYEWTENENRKLKAAMEFFPAHDFIREPEDRWRRVAGFVNTKNVNECKEEVQFQEVRFILELIF